MTPEQLRMFKGAIDVSAKTLAEDCDVSLGAIKQYLKGESSPGSENRNKILDYIDACGYELKDNYVRKKTQNIRILQGKKGFRQFFDDVYKTIKQNGGQILVSNVDERLYEEWSDNDHYHPERMAKLNNFTSRILICEGDKYYKASAYSEYRWQPKQYFNNNSWYVYGDKLALIQFEQDDVFITIFNNKRATSSFRVTFNQIWDNAIIPEKQPA